MALEEDIPDQPDDKTIPKYKQIDKVTNFPTLTPPSLSFSQKYFTASPPTNPYVKTALACRFIHNLLGP